MTRVLSALVLLPVVIGAVWFLPPIATLVLACLAALLAFVEYAGILAALDIHIPRVVSGIAVAAACIAVGLSLVSVDLLLMSAVIVAGALAVASGNPSPRTIHEAVASVFPTGSVASTWNVWPPSVSWP